VYKEQVELRLDEFDTRIDALRARAEAVNTGQKGPAIKKRINKKRINKRIDELEKRKEAVHNQINNIDSVSIEGWENYQNTVNTAMNNLERSYNRINRRLPK
jgi:hypothetical protein